LLRTLLTKREQYHSNVLTQSVSMFEQATRTRIEQLTQYFMNHGVIDRVDAAHRAYVAVGHVVQKQAYILAFSDTFYALGAALIVALLAGLAAQEARPDFGHSVSFLVVRPAILEFRSISVPASYAIPLAILQTYIFGRRRRPLHARPRRQRIGCRVFGFGQ